MEPQDRKRRYLTASLGGAYHEAATWRSAAERATHGRDEHTNTLHVFIVCGLAIFAAGCHIEFHGHLESIHEPPFGNAEHYCVEDLSDGLPTLEGADNTILEALSANGHSQDWESLPTIDQSSYGDCENVDTLSEIAELDITYKVTDTHPPGCLDGSCMVQPQSGNDSHDGFLDYDQVIIYLKSSDVSVPASLSFMRHTVNHETGHAYGLADPTPSSVPNSYRDCWMQFDTNGDGNLETVRVYSIMHNRGWCGAGFPNYPWPTDCDLRIVELIAQKHDFANAESPADYKGGLCED